MKNVFEEYKVHYARKITVPPFPGQPKSLHEAHLSEGQLKSSEGEIQVSTSFRASYDEGTNVLVIDRGAFSNARNLFSLEVQPQPPMSNDQDGRILVTIRDEAAAIRYVVAKADEFYNFIKGWCTAVGEELHVIVPTEAREESSPDVRLASSLPSSLSWPE